MAVPVRGTGVFATFVVVTIAALLVLGGPAAQPAHACSCVGLSDDEAFAQSEVVFLGEVVDYEPPPSREVMSSTDPAIWTFKVSEVYKGDVAATQRIVSEWSGASCGLEIPQRGEFLVFARPESTQIPVGEAQYYAGLCGGTRSSELGPLTGAVAPSSPRATTTAPSPARTEPPQDAIGQAARARDDVGVDVPVVLAALAIIGCLVGLTAVELRRRAGPN